MEALIDAGADVDAQNEIAKMTPLHCAIRGTFQSFKQTHARRIRCVELLLRAGADTSVCDLKGKDAFGCIDVAVREARVREIGDIDEEMEEMRRVLRTAGVSMSRLGGCIEEMDAGGVERCLGGSGGAETKEGDGATPMEVEKGLLAAADKFKLLLEDMSKEGGVQRNSANRWARRQPPRRGGARRRANPRRIRIWLGWGRL